MKNDFKTKMIRYIQEKYPSYMLTVDILLPEINTVVDCYIKEVDLYIDFKENYLHNYREYRDTSIHRKEYEELCDQGLEKQMIANVWKNIDVEKREYFKKNNLNYLEYWEELCILPEEVKSKAMKVLYYQQRAFFKPNEEQLKDPLRRWYFYRTAIKHGNFYARHNYVNHHALLIRPYIVSQIGYSSFNFSLCNIVPKDKVVYDPCGGWGHRLCGFKDHKGYIYNDINTEVFNNCIRLAEEEKINNATFYNEDAATVKINEDYDVVFTCPPYYNKEIFSEHGAENFSEEDFSKWWNSVMASVKPKDKEIYIVINSQFFKYFSKNELKYEIIKSSLRKSHYHKSSKQASEIVVKFSI